MNKLVNKALVTKETDGTKSTSVVELIAPVSRKEMYSYCKGLDAKNNVRRMWNGVLGESRTGSLQPTKSEFIKAICKKGGHKEADKIIKDMLVF